MTNLIQNSKSEKVILHIDNVNFSFGNTEILKNISLNINQGDFLALIGPNGSGKTTLLKLILGLLPLSEGSILLCNENIKNFSKWNKIGYVPQKVTDFDINFPANVSEIVKMGLLANKKFPKIINKEDQLAIQEALKVVQMDSFSKRRIGELSGGQQQRVFIAKAIVQKPLILFLDEPTTGIDQENQKKFYELLYKLNQEGITIILVSHDISHITKYVTKIASLNQNLQFFGSHKDFCSFDKEHHHLRGEHDICLHR